MLDSIIADACDGDRHRWDARIHADAPELTARGTLRVGADGRVSLSPFGHYAEPVHRQEPPSGQAGVRLSPAG